MNRYTFNKRFFQEPNKLNSYWAGFFAADGYVRLESRNRSRIGLHLSKVDENHLRRFVNDIEFSGEVHRRKDETITVEIFGILSLARDLERNFNIVPKKSLVLTPPNIIDNDLICSYIIGYIDGDGWVSHKSYSYSQDCLELGVAGTFSVLSWIKFYFDILYPATTKRVPAVKAHGNIFKYRISGKRANHIVGFLNQFNVPKLERKWSKLELIKEL